MHLFIFLTGFLHFVFAYETQTIRVGDMLVEIDERDSTPRAALKAHVKRWKNGVIPLHFERGITIQQKRLFMEACEDWGKTANISCFEGEYDGKTLRIGHWTEGCWALWGSGSHFLGLLKRRMNLSKNCWKKETILHELGHSLGLIHEHQREDRNQYIRVIKKNIDGVLFGLNTRINFGEQEIEYASPYDFLSIMHYARDAFSKNGKDTLIPKPPHESYINRMGRQTGLSEFDRETVARLYGL